MMEQDELLAQQQLLEINRRTLSFYLQQVSIHSTAHVPPSIMHGIHESRDNIKRIKGVLRAAEVHVEDLPSDEHRNLFNNDERSNSDWRSAPHELRAPLRDFIGRNNQISQVRDILNSSNSVNITALQGMGGIGKTELALKIADELKGEYPDAQLFIELRGMDKTPRESVDILIEYLHRFGCEEDTSVCDVDKLAKLYRGYLDGKRGVIVLDNAANESQIESLMPPRGWIVIVTSRNLLPMPGLMLDQFLDNDGEELLIKIAPRIDTKTAKRICLLCGFLPLAIRAAGSLLAVTPDLKPESYADQLQNEHTRLERIGQRGVSIGVTATLNLSYSLMSEAVQCVFRKLAVLVGSFAAETAIVIAQDTYYHTHLSDLVQRSMVLFDEKTSKYRLHDLVRLFAENHLGNEDQEKTLERLIAYYLKTEKPKAVRIHGIDFPESPFINSNKSTLSQEEIRLNLHAAGIALSNLANTYASRNNLLHAIELYQKSTPLLEKFGDEIEQGVVTRNLILTYMEAKLPHLAKELQERQSQKSFSEYYANIKKLGMVNLENILQTVSNPKHVVMFCEQCLDWMRKNNIDDHLAEIRAYVNLAYAYEGLGEFERALAFADYALELDSYYNLLTDKSKLLHLANKLRKKI